MSLDDRLKEIFERLTKLETKLAFAVKWLLPALALDRVYEHVAKLVTA